MSTSSRCHSTQPGVPSALSCRAATAAAAQAAAARAAESSGGRRRGLRQGHGGSGVAGAGGCSCAGAGAQHTSRLSLKNQAHSSYLESILIANDQALDSCSKESKNQESLRRRQRCCNSEWRGELQNCLKVAHCTLQAQTIQHCNTNLFTILMQCTKKQYNM